MSEDKRFSELLGEILSETPKHNSTLGVLAQEKLNEIPFTGQVGFMLFDVFSAYFRAENELYGKKVPPSHDCKPMYASEEGLSVGDTFKCSVCDKTWVKAKKWNDDRSYDIFWAEVTDVG